MRIWIALSALSVLWAVGAFGCEAKPKDEPAPLEAKSEAPASRESAPREPAGDASARPEPKPSDRLSPEPGPPESILPREPGPPDTPPADTGSQEKPKKTTVTGGSAEGKWCGEIEVKGTVTVDQGKSLEICAGSVLTFDRSAGLSVLGTLWFRGAKDGRIALQASGAQWQGIQATGEIKGGYVTLKKGLICILGRAASKIQLDHATLDDCKTSLRLSNGGTFTHTQVLRGNSVSNSGGELRMTDSVIDLKHPTQSPDCTSISGGSMVLNHVRFTGCHCPIHINKTAGPVEIRNSIFDGATYPVMIANSTATFRNNHFVKGSADILDIGGGIKADIADNYWGGGAPKITSGDPKQFTGAATYSKTPFPQAGPRK